MINISIVMIDLAKVFIKCFFFALKSTKIDGHNGEQIQGQSNDCESFWYT